MKLYTTGGARVTLFDPQGREYFADSQAATPGTYPNFTAREELPHPYALPTSAPYAVPDVAITPTPYGEPHAAVHPSVVDMVAETGDPFRGFRYWMAMTPYADSDDQLENPCIVMSNNGYHWHVPDGLTNPLDGPPPGSYYSDTDLVWDRITKRFVVCWRHHGAGYHVATSRDGVKWDKTLMTSDSSVSASIVRVSAYDWRLFLGSQKAASGAGFHYWRSSTPTGPWSDPTYAVPLTGSGTNMWHEQVRWDETTKHFWLIGSTLGDGLGLFPAVSRDGKEWVVGAPILREGTAYRAAFVQADDPTLMDVWYSYQGAPSPGGWWIKHTRMPRSLWSDLIV